MAGKASGGTPKNSQGGKAGASPKAMEKATGAKVVKSPAVKGAGSTAKQVKGGK